MKIVKLVLTIILTLLFIFLMGLGFGLVNQERYRRECTKLMNQEIQERDVFWQDLVNKEREINGH